jgi:hypothetical protein
VISGLRLGDGDGDRLGHGHLHARSRTDRLGEAAHLRPHHGASGEAVGRAEMASPVALSYERRLTTMVLVVATRPPGSSPSGARAPATVVTGSPVSDGSAMATVRDW